MDFKYNNLKIDYGSLAGFIKNEYFKLYSKMFTITKKRQVLEANLVYFKKDFETKQEYYKDKQREIATYLECKKTFMGKLRYFFKNKKRIKMQKMLEEIIEKNEKNIENRSLSEDIDLKKEFYTIEDLVALSINFEKEENIIKNTNMDIMALTNNLKILENKLQNACIYIKEIDNHNKSIFDFWKFCNKDELLKLNSSVEEEKSKIEIEKIFKYDDDVEDFKIQIDKIQRELFSKEQRDSIFIASTDLLYYINTENVLLEDLENLKNIKKNEEFYDMNNFDIFGNLFEDRTKIKKLGNQKHRELKKDKLKILEIENNMNLDVYKNKLQNINKNLKESFKNAKLPCNMSVYKATNREEELQSLGYHIFNINDNKVIKNTNDEKINLYKLNLKKNVPAIFFSNIIFYDNNNKTLPFGMYESDELLLQFDILKLEQKNKKEFNILSMDENKKVKMKNIILYEYEVDFIENYN